MTPVLASRNWRRGACIAVFAPPPYLGLRSYNTEPQVWGGSEGCDHEWGEEVRREFEQGNARHKVDTDGLPHGDRTTNKTFPVKQTACGSTCRLCHAWRGELGLEPTPDLYVAHLLEVFASVRRVLRSDGTLWVNLGDSYSAGSRTGAQPGQGVHDRDYRDQCTHRTNGGLPAGSLLQIPARFSLAMQAEGWLLRSAMVLAKASPMPESVSGCRWERCKVKTKGCTDTGRGAKYRLDPARTARSKPSLEWGNNRAAVQCAEYAPCPGCEKCADSDGYVLRWGMGRPTSSYEMLYCFAKSSRYFYNSEAVRLSGPGGNAHGNGATLIPGRCEQGPDLQRVWGQQGGANARNVLAWKPAPLADAHFAAFPPFIPTFAIRAGTAEQVCGECGAPWAPCVERSAADEAVRGAMAGHHFPGNSPEKIQTGNVAHRTKGWQGGGYTPGTTVTAHRPTCRHDAPPGAAVCLDPFCGSGTTLMVAERLGRDAIGIDLQPDYVAIARRRAEADAGLFAAVDVCDGLPEENGQAQLAWEW